MQENAPSALPPQKKQKKMYFWMRVLNLWGQFGRTNRQSGAVWHWRVNARDYAVLRLFRLIWAIFSVWALCGGVTSLSDASAYRPTGRYRHSKHNKPITSLKLVAAATSNPNPNRKRHLNLTEPNRELCMQGGPKSKLLILSKYVNKP